MISPLKLKIISWYTVFVSVILIAVFTSLYLLLGYQMNIEIKANIKERLHLAEKELERSRDSNIKSGKKAFIDIASSHVFNRNIRDFTDGFDDECLIVVYRNNRLSYLSERYENLRPELFSIFIPQGTVSDINIGNLFFKISCITFQGQTFYLGYNLAEVKAVQSRIVYLFLIVFPFGILFSILIGYFVTQRSLNVIHKITKTVDQITSKNLHQRVPIPVGKDEITELIHTLNAMIHRIEESFNAARQFSHDAAHELRTPLTVLRGELEAILDQPVESVDTHQSLESMLEEIQYLSHIADKLLMLHNFETGNIKYPFTKIRLDELVKETVEDAEILGKEKNLNIDLSNNVSLTVSSNRELMLRLLWNLFDNAVKYTPKDGKISVSLKKKNQHVEISVSDTGIGIDEKEQVKIFERFYRIDKSRSRRISGSGLGLSICQQIIERHGGTITVKSKLGQGSTFIIKLPLDGYRR
jgi:heavy metal sensor kinase